MEYLVNTFVLHTKSYAPPTAKYEPYATASEMILRLIVFNSICSFLFTVVLLAGFRIRIRCFCLDPDPNPVFKFSASGYSF